METVQTENGCSLDTEKRLENDIVIEIEDAMSVCRLILGSVVCEMMIESVNGVFWN